MWRISPVGKFQSSPTGHLQDRGLTVYRHDAWCRTLPFEEGGRGVEWYVGDRLCKKDHISY